MVVSYIDRRPMNTEANHKQKMSKRRKWNTQDGYLGFSKIVDFDPQNFKSKLRKIASSPNFQKPYYMYRPTYEYLVGMPNFKSLSRCLTPSSCNKCEVWWRHNIKSHFWGIYRHRTQKQITPLDSWDKTESEKKCFIFKILNLKMDPFWPFLTWGVRPGTRQIVPGLTPSSLRFFMKIGPWVTFRLWIRL